MKYYHYIVLSLTLYVDCLTCSFDKSAVSTASSTVDQQQSIPVRYNGSIEPKYKAVTICEYNHLLRITMLPICNKNKPSSDPILDFYGLFLKRND